MRSNRQTKRPRRARPLVFRPKAGPALTKQFKVEVGTHLFPDVPTFGYQVVTVGTVRVWIAWNLENGWLKRRPDSTCCFFTEAEALAFKEQVKADIAKAQQEAARRTLIVPGSPEWSKPPLLLREEKRNNA